jgi:hypothetical protein
MTIMKQLSRNDILSHDDFRKEKVEVPEWDGYVYVKGLTSLERDQWENSLYEVKKGNSGSEVLMKRENIRARFCAVSVVDESNTLMFSPADLEALGRKSALALERIFTVAQRLSGLTAEDLEELEKNLKKAPDATSPSN